MDLPIIPPPLFRPRPLDAHKMSIGRVLVIGGAVGTSGAVRLASLAALAGGAGLVRVAVPEPVRAEAAGREQDLMVHGVAATATGGLSPAGIEYLRGLAAESDAIVLGPGAGRHPATLALLRDLVRVLTQPAVVDADALRAIAPLLEGSPEWGGPRVLTPHPGEAAGLLGVATHTISSDRVSSVRRLDALVGERHVTVLKGHETLVAAAGRVARAKVGNPALAVAGTGDVLAGLVGSLLAAGQTPVDAAEAGVWLHGHAGDLGRKTYGERPFTASALLGCVGAAVRGQEA